MVLRLDTAEPIVTGLQRIATEQLSEAVARLEAALGPEPPDLDRTVHEVRKRCKEARGILHLLRPGLGGEFRTADRLIRDAARALAPLRDDHVRRKTLATLGPDLDDGPGTGEGAAVGDDVGASDLDTDVAVAEALASLTEARDRIAGWQLADSFEPITDGLAATYRRGRRRLRQAAKDPGDENLHDWRKSVKHLWYQVRLLEGSAPSVLSPLAQELDRLGESLGEDHDLAVLVDDLGRLVDDAEVDQTSSQARARQAELRSAALRQGATIYAESASSFAKRLQAYWRATQRFGPEPGQPAVADPVEDVAGRAAVELPRLVADDSVEHERTFLVDEVDLPAEGRRIVQGYLPLAVERAGTGVSVRLREEPDGRTLTMKAGSGPSRTELEAALAPVSADALWDAIGDRRLEKVRHRVPIGELTAEVDVYLGSLAPLRLVEVEFESAEAMAAFEPPAWFGPEVTDDPRYSNEWLATNGRPDDNRGS